MQRQHTPYAIGDLFNPKGKQGEENQRLVKRKR